MYSSYGALCTEVYDLTKPLGFSFGDVEYYTERLTGVTGKVLEVGCGSGRVMIPLIQAGLDVEGLDNSPAMLDSCRRQCAQLQLKPQLYQEEMYDFKLPHPYEAIIIPGGSFQLIEGRALAIAALAHFNACLTSGGRLILDLFIPTDVQEHAHSTKTWTTPAQEVLVLEERCIERNLLEQRVVSLLKYEKWKDGSLLQTELQRLPLSWYGVHEFELMLEKAGFTEIVVSADYEYKRQPERAGQMITYEATRV